MNAIEIIEQLNKDWFQNYGDTDTKKFASYLHEDFIYTGKQGVFKKKEYIKDVVSGRIKRKLSAKECIEITDFGYTALCVGETELINPTYTTKSNHNFTLVWHRVEDEWKAVAYYES
ncbi:nuclear transport factor 2 family protein [Aquimarina brevivitae]|uniref:Uncharacterized protein DUF4440 n=1 Tax=Aquimarina brevivitae TaxID=323412 RepID=A0A4Q7PJ30_9FLAO|nr:nuclear transport factor 2 family protein [Aquimarina brevivitae]RZS99840.1 uncharacterized protein DUF4440 [Aquimarina brevivitae]